MKKYTILIISLALTTSVFARGHQQSTADVLVPMIIGGVIVGAIINSNKETPPPAPPAVVYVEPQPQHPSVHYGRKYQVMRVFDSNCNCTRLMPVEIN